HHFHPLARVVASARGDEDHRLPEIGEGPPVAETGPAVRESDLVPHRARAKHRAPGAAWPNLQRHHGPTRRPSGCIRIARCIRIVRAPIVEDDLVARATWSGRVDTRQDQRRQVPRASEALTKPVDGGTPWRLGRLGLRLAEPLLYRSVDAGAGHRGQPAGRGGIRSHRRRGQHGHAGDSDQSHDQQAPWISIHDAPPVRAAHTREKPAHDNTSRGPVYLLLPVAPGVGTRGWSARTTLSMPWRVLYGFVILRLPA